MTHRRAGSQLKTDVPLGLLSVPPGAPLGAGNMMYFGETAIIITDRATAGKILHFFRRTDSWPAQ